MLPRADPRALRVVVSIAATLGLVAWVAWRVDLRSVAAALASMRVGYVALAAVALGPLQVVGAAERWRSISARLDRPIPRARAVREVALSAIVNQLLPGGIGGDALRAWRGTAPDDAGRLGAVRAVVADRVLAFGVHVAVVASSLALWAAVNPAPVPRGAVVVVGGLLAVLAAVVGVPARVPVLGTVGADLRAVLGDPTSAAAVVGWSLASNALFVAAFAACGPAVGVPLGWVAPTALPLVLLSMAVPLGFGGLGLREATAVAVLPRLGVDAEHALAISAAYAVAASVGTLPGALVPLWDR